MRLRGCHQHVETRLSSTGEMQSLISTLRCYAPNTVIAAGIEQKIPVLSVEILPAPFAWLPGAQRLVLPALPT